MARFRLKEKHYIYIEGNEWEYEETDQATGKKLRKRFEVPQHLDPDNRADCNYPEGIIVSTKADPKYPRDLIFIGLPTPDMEPLDEEAEAMLEDYRNKHRGEHPIDSLPNSLAETIAQALERQINQMGGREKYVNSALPVSAEEFEALKKSNEELKAQLNEILARMPKPEPVSRRA